MNERIAHSLPDLSAFAHEFVGGLSPKKGATVVALTGNLGAGKTAFAQMLGEVLGVEEHVVSPTFILMRTYATKHPVWKKFVHIDAYRFEEEREADVLRLPEIFLEASTLVVIEWPERIGELLPKDAIELTFEINPDDSRRIMYA